MGACDLAHTYLTFRFPSKKPSLSRSSNQKLSSNGCGFKKGADSQESGLSVFLIAFFLPAFSSLTKKNLLILQYLPLTYSLANLLLL